MTEPDASGSPIEPTGENDASGGASVVVTGAQDAGIGPLPPAPAGDGASSSLWIADAAPMRASDCVPGTYAGTFTMMVSGLFGGGLTLTGNLSIVLVANTPSAQFGEFNSGILTVAPGALFTGKDNLGDSWTANVSGQLDCGTRMFVGTLSNGICDIFGSDAAAITLDGSLSANYSPAAHPVAFTGGALTLMSPQVALTMGMGTWSAALQ